MIYRGRHASFGAYYYVAYAAANLICTDCASGSQQCERATALSDKCCGLRAVICASVTAVVTTQTLVQCGHGLPCGGVPASARPSVSPPSPPARPYMYRAHLVTPYTPVPMVASEPRM